MSIKETLIKYITESTALAVNHQVTQEQAAMFLNLFDGDLVRASRMCRFIDNGMKFYDVYMIATMSIEVSKDEN